MKLLKIDIDFIPPKEWWIIWQFTRESMLEELGYEIEYIKRFDSKRGIHVYIKLKQDVDDETANMLQFLCGDDHSRVRINMWRISRGIPFWNKLFEKKIYSKKSKYIVCRYCGNKIPIIEKEVKAVE